MTLALKERLGEWETRVHRVWLVLKALVDYQAMWESLEPSGLQAWLDKEEKGVN